MSNLLKFSLDSNGVATITFDLENEKVNKLSVPVLIELNSLIDEVANNKKVHLLLFKSDKKDIFIAGADINEIKEIRNETDAFKKVLQGQDILTKIADLKIPTIALINGAALGGGLELALACDYRVATDNKKTVLGLPEVNLGIIPGFGGTQRLPRLVGLQESLKMILSGKSIDYKKAFKIGLVDKVIRGEFLKEELENFIAVVITKTRSAQIRPNKCSVRKKRFVFEVLLGGKHLIFYFAHKDLMVKTKGKYPAQLAAFDVIKKTYHTSDYAAGLRLEAEEFAKLASGSISKNLIEIFFTNEEIRKDSGAGDTQAIEVKQAGLMGAGIMGGGIAWLFSNSDIPVRMKDISQFGIALGFNQVLKIYKQLKKIGKYKDNQIALKMDEISSTTDYSGFNNVDIVVEAIVENIEVKKDSFAELEHHVKKSTIIASNTSSLSITEMSKAFKDPERFVGMHFFNPVNKMPLVEVIKGEKTSDVAVATVVALSKRLGKTPIVVSDVAGFLVNRILLPYINEAGFLLQEGADLKNIDHLIEDFGMPMGPFVLADTVGIDVGYKVAKSLHEAYGERMNVCALLVEISKNKELLGKKSGKGFYRYSKEGKLLGVNPQMHKIIHKTRDIANIEKTYISKHDIVDRCIFIMINEAAKCLEEGVVKNHRFLDMAMIMGTGFPAFRGGLLRYADEVGVSVVVARLREFSKSYGPRFEPSSLLVKMDEEGKKFYVG